jgi:hypothetical protein
MEVREVDISCVVSTDAGMCGIWQPEAFAHVTDLDSWEDDVAEEGALIRYIRAGEFAPINVGGDGAFQIAVRGYAGIPTLSQREARYRLVTTSEPYLLVSYGMLELSGLEAVGSYSSGSKTQIPLVAGRYSVVIHLIDWKAEPGAVKSDGKAIAGALPDFVVELSSAQVSALKYRTQVQTFEPG